MALREIGCLVWNTLAHYHYSRCESDIKEVHGNFSNSLFEKNVHRQKYTTDVDKCSFSIPYINDFILNDIWNTHCQHTAQDNLCPNIFCNLYTPSAAVFEPGQHIITISKSGIWVISPSMGLGHEMLYAVYLVMFWLLNAKSLPEPVLTYC